MRSDTPYSDLYERTQDLSALAQAAAYWALDILRTGISGRHDEESAAKDAFILTKAWGVLRAAMRLRREMRDKRNLILAESFKREVCGGS